jgi:hypothetical protein
LNQPVAAGDPSTLKEVRHGLPVDPVAVCEFVDAGSCLVGDHEVVDLSWSEATLNLLTGLRIGPWRAIRDDFEQASEQFSLVRRV